MQVTGAMIVDISMKLTVCEHTAYELYHLGQAKCSLCAYSIIHLVVPSIDRVKSVTPHSGAATAVTGVKWGVGISCIGIN